MLAQIGAYDLGQWILAFAVVLGFGIAALKAWYYLRRRPPLEVEFVRRDEFESLLHHHDQTRDRVMQSVTRQEFESFRFDVHKQIDSLRDRIDAANDRLLEKLDDVKTEILTSHERRVIAIHERVNGLERESAATRARLEGLMKK